MDKQNREFVWRSALIQARMRNQWDELLRLIETSESIPTSLRNDVAVAMLMKRGMTEKG
jgi:hypothetical protein